MADFYVVYDAIVPVKGGFSVEPVLGFVAFFLGSGISRFSLRYYG